MRSEDGINWYFGNKPTPPPTGYPSAGYLNGAFIDSELYVKYSKDLRFEDEPIIETSTIDIEEGSSTNLPEGSLYIVYKEA
jgi:hypothetical protein